MIEPRILTMKEAYKQASFRAIETKEKCKHIAVLMSIAKMTLTEINTLDKEERRVLADWFTEQHEEGLDKEDVRGMFQCCYNYIRNQKDSDFKQSLMEELEKVGCV